MILYRGWRRPNGRTDVVRFIGRAESWLLPMPGEPSTVKRPFDWGGLTPGARALALALLYDIGACEELSRMFAGRLVKSILQYLGRASWSLTSDELYLWFMDENSTLRKLSLERVAREDEEEGLNNGGPYHA